MDKKKKSFIIRTLVAVPLFALFMMILFFENWFFKIFLTLLMIISQFEVTKSAKSKVKNINVYIPYVVAAAASTIFYLFGYLYVILLYAIAVFWLLVESVISKKRDVNSLSMNLLVLFYPSVLFIFLFGMDITHTSEIRMLMILLTFSASIAVDTAAYLIGSKFGKHKLSPQISPKKSVEGAVAGYIFGFIIIILIGLFLQGALKTDVEIINFIILGLILPVLIQIGDLFASQLKRDFGIKDFGSIFPGHGGVLDRLDSGLFICPVVYCYFTLIYGTLLF